MSHSYTVCLYIVLTHSMKTTMRTPTATSKMRNRIPTTIPSIVTRLKEPLLLF